MAAGLQLGKLQVLREVSTPGIPQRNPARLTESSSGELGRLRGRAEPSDQEESRVAVEGVGIVTGMRNGEVGLQGPGSEAGQTEGVESCAEGTLKALQEWLGAESKGNWGWV